VDVEGTIEFILENQAKTEIRLGGITKLLQQGMRMLVKTDTKVAQLAEAQKRTDAKLARLADVHRELAAEVKGVAAEVKELAKAQRETERTLRAFIRAQRNGRNGRR
jgi:hypothetical protein